jgi:outer membrane protein TolC
LKLKTIFQLLPCLLAPLVLYAQSDSMPLPPDSALKIALTKIEGEPIRLSDVVQGALDHATDVQDALAAMQAAEGSLTKQRGAFDPELFAEGSKSSEQQPSSSPFSGADVLHPVTTSGNAGARITLPVGTELSASIAGIKQETNSSFSSLNPQYNATSLLTIRQPLLQGFGPAAWGDLSAAKNRYRAAKNRYLDAVAGTRAATEGLYWDLYAAERDLAVSKLIHEQATSLLGEASLRATAGLVGPNEVNNAKVFQAEQELSLLDADDNLSRISDQLATMLGRRPSGDFSRFRTLDDPPLQSPAEPLDSLLTRAFRTNHLLLAAEAEVNAAQTQVRAAWWNALPQADLFGSLGGNGLAGQGRDVVFLSDTLHNTRNDHFSDALSQALQRSFPTWTIGLRVTVPLLFREKRGEHQRLQSELDRSRIRYLQLKRAIEAQVRLQFRELEQGNSRIKAAENGVLASVDQTRIGLIQFKNGKTTAFELVRLGADLATAQRRYSQSLVRTAKATAQLTALAPLE